MSIISLFTQKFINKKIILYHFITLIIHCILFCTFIFSSDEISIIAFSPLCKQHNFSLICFFNATRRSSFCECMSFFGPSFLLLELEKLELVVLLDRFGTVESSSSVWVSHLLKHNLLTSYQIIKTVIQTINLMRTRTGLNSTLGNRFSKNQVNNSCTISSQFDLPNSSMDSPFRLTSVESKTNMSASHFSLYVFHR